MNAPTSAPQSRLSRRHLSTPYGDAVVVPTEFYLDSLIPPLPAGIDATYIYSLLKTQPLTSWRAITSKGRWRGFAEDPALSSSKLPFKHVQTIVTAITRASSRLCARTPHIFRTYEGKLPPDDKGEDSLPDGCLLIASTTLSEVSWFDIAVSAAYKRTDSAADETGNAAKIVQNMNNCLYKDPLRRFTLGFTIENTSMKFWYCDRSVLLVSESFNFNSNHMFVIRFFLSCIYADLADLGWDPTMSRTIESSNLQQYDIAVRNTDGQQAIYRTRRLISDLGAQHIRSRGTRVWEAVKLEDGIESGESVVLKDAWVDEELQREGDVLSDFRAQDRTADMQELINQSFLSVLCHGDVYVGRAGPDAEQRPDLTKASLLPTGIYSAIASARRSDLLEHANVRTPLTFRKKVHYRIVFSELCTSIEDETSLKKIFKAISATFVALDLMHQSGWIHHDVSTGNVLIDAEGNVRLADMEYARRIDSDIPDNRVGTWNFMPVEVDKQEYCFLLSKIGPRSYPLEPVQTQDVKLAPSIAGEHPPIPFQHALAGLDKTLPPPPFRYNPLHDVESLWWLAVYFLFNREIIPADGDDTVDDTEYTRAHEQRNASARMFHNSTERYFTFGFSGPFERHLATLHPSLRIVGGLLEAIREQLFYTYCVAERDPTSISHTVASEFCAELKEAFLVIVEDLDEDDIRLRPFTELKLKPCTSVTSSNSSKRSRDEMESFTESSPAPDTPTPSPPKKARTTVEGGPATRTRSKVRATAL